MSFLTKINPLSILNRTIERKAREIAKREIEQIDISKAFKTTDLSYQTWWEQQYGPITKRDYCVAMERHIWTYVAAYAISTTVASIPMKIYPEGKVGNKDAELKKGAYLFDLIKEPFDDVSYFDMMEQIMTFLELTGDVFIEKDDPIKPSQLKVLRSYWCEVFADTRGIYQMQYKPNGVVMATLDPIDYFHIKWFNPMSELYGLGSGQAATDSMINDFHAINYTKTFFKNGGMFNMYIAVAKTLGEHEYNRMKREATDNWGGDKNVGIKVLDSDAELKNAGFDPSTILLAEQRAFLRDEILACFGVPPAVVGVITEKQSTYNNVREQKTNFYQQTIIPKLTKIEGAFNRNLFNRFNCECKFDVGNIDVLKEDSKNQAMTATSLVKDGVMTPDEVREKFYSLPPIPGGDTLRTPAPAFGFPAGTSDPAAADVPEQGAGDAGIAAPLTLNGAQISAAVDVVSQFNAGVISQFAAVELLVAVGIERASAERMVVSKLNPAQEQANAEFQKLAQKPADPKKQLAIGRQVEMEHTDDPNVAEQIARDHLAEFPNYYTALLDMERKLKQQTTRKGHDCGYSPNYAEVMPSAGQVDWTGRQSQTPRKNNLEWATRNWTANGTASDRAHDPRGGRNALRPRPEREPGQPGFRKGLSSRSPDGRQRDLKYPNGGPSLRHNAAAMGHYTDQGSPQIGGAPRKAAPFKKHGDAVEVFIKHHDKWSLDLENALRDVLRNAEERVVKSALENYPGGKIKKKGEWSAGGDWLEKVLATLDDTTIEMMDALLKQGGQAAVDYVEQNYRRFGIPKPDPNEPKPVADPNVPSWERPSSINNDPNILTRVRASIDYHNHQWAPRVAADASDYLVNTVRTQLLHAAEDDLHPLEMAKNLAAVFKGQPDAEIDYPRARLIARTEMTDITNFANTSMARESGFTVKKWITFIDDATRDWHIDADGQEVGIDEDFVVDGVPMGYPGDKRGGAGNVCNCRCAMNFA